jgi:hypothetical protein
MKSESFSILLAKEASKQDGHIEETHVTSTLNINDVNRSFVDEIQCEEAIPNVIEKIPAKQLFHTR